MSYSQSESPQQGAVSLDVVVKVVLDLTEYINNMEPVYSEDEFDDAGDPVRVIPWIYPSTFWDGYRLHPVTKILTPRALALIRDNCSQLGSFARLLETVEPSAYVTSGHRLTRNQLREELLVEGFVCRGNRYAWDLRENSPCQLLLHEFESAAHNFYDDASGFYSDISYVLRHNGYDIPTSWYDARERYRDET